VKLWRAPISTAEATATTSDKAARSIFLHTYAVTALNPKSLTFFIAFLPQFLQLDRPVLPQMIIFEITFLVLATLNATLYAMLADAARTTIRKPAVQRTVNRVGGSLLVGAGAAAVALPQRTG
jgi:threonine/homoserine/homoserine lactone efflux protein